jgi:hypothetical protein
MTSDHRPFLPQLLVLLREDEEQAVEPTPSEEEAKARHARGFHRSESIRQAG